MTTRIEPQTAALIKEGRRIVERTEEDSWRLAEIIHELHEDGMTYQAIAGEFGWDRRQTAASYDKALVRRDAHRFSEALLFVGMSPQRVAATEAVAERDDRAIATVKTRPDVSTIAQAIKDVPKDEQKAAAKTIAAAISEAPDDLKEEIAAEVVQDEGIFDAAMDRLGDEHAAMIAKRVQKTPVRSTTPIEIAALAAARDAVRKAIRDLKGLTMSDAAGKRVTGLLDSIDDQVATGRALVTPVTDEAIHAMIEEGS